MQVKIDKPSIIEASGIKPKLIEEFIGRVNSGTNEISVARMTSPSGWIEPDQQPGCGALLDILISRIIKKNGGKSTSKDGHDNQKTIFSAVRIKY
jgi:hypothetical protein